jgi:glycosyltransferase involved in cell wall biosynthesis
MARSRLSMVVITLNEEANLPRWLDSIRFTDEIVVVDSGSEDATCDIARGYTDKVLFHEMKGFGAQKQFAIEQTTGDWIFSLDADEWVSNSLRRSIESAMESDKVNPQYDGFMIYRRNIFLGRPMRYCGWYKPILRLFRRGRGRFDEKLVHEELLVDGQIGFLNGDIMHEPYKDIFHHLVKMQNYAQLDAQELIRKGRKVHGWQAPIHLTLRPLWKFTEKLVLQQGFREGVHGLVLSSMAAFGVFLMHVQCWQLQKRILRKHQSVQ